MTLVNRCVLAPQQGQEIFASESLNHGMVWVGRDLQGSSSPTPGSAQGHLQLDQVAQSPVQPGLERFQGWGLHHLPGQPVPGFHHPHGKKFLPYIQSKPLSSHQRPGLSEALLFCRRRKGKVQASFRLVKASEGKARRMER